MMPSLTNFLPWVGEQAPTRTICSALLRSLMARPAPIGITPRIIETPALRGITVAGALGMTGAGFLTVGFPFFAVEHLGQERSAAGCMWAAPM